MYDYLRKKKQNLWIRLQALALATTFFMWAGCTNIQYQDPFKQKTGYDIQYSLEDKIKKEQYKKNIAVFLIDMQDSFLKSINTSEKEREVPYQIEVLDYCKRNEIPVFVLEYEGHGSTTNILKKRLDELDNKVYITKFHEDGFKDTDLSDQLNQRGIKNILLMGVNASACVLNTAKGAISKGYKIMTSKDLIADKVETSWQFWWDYNESIDWYKENGIYSDDYKDLLAIISQN